MTRSGLIQTFQAARRASGAALLVVGIGMAVGLPSAAAQSRPKIQPRRGDQTIRHNERLEPQVFAATQWGVKSNSDRGATVTLSCGPFQNKNDPSSYADGQLALGVSSSQNRANWTVKIAKDRTNVNGRKRAATVMALADDRGVGVLELTVTFLGADVLELAEGDYSTTVTGTITAH